MHQRGFAIIELLVTIIILGILGGIGYLYFQQTLPTDTPISLPEPTTLTPTKTPVVSNNIDDPYEFETTPVTEISGKLIFMRDNNIWLRDQGTLIQLTNDGLVEEVPYFSGMPEIWNSSPKISPNGKTIGYIKNQSVGFRYLHVTNPNGTTDVRLRGDIAWIFPVFQWSSDSQEIYYVAETKSYDITQGDSYDLAKVHIETGKTEILGSFYVRSGCGGYSPDPSDHLAQSENIFGVGGGVMVFELSPDNKYVLHSVSCAGEGINLFDLVAKKDYLLDEKARKASFSPDENLIAVSRSDNKLAFYHLPDGTLKNIHSLPVAPGPLIWDYTNTRIYYSSVELTRTVNLDDETTLDLLGSSNVSFRINSSSLWEFNINNANNRKLMETEAHALRPVYADRAGSMVIAAFVENADNLHTHMSSGGTKESLMNHYPKINVRLIDSATGTTLNTFENASQADYQH